MKVERIGSDLYFEGRRLVVKDSNDYMKINGIDTTTNTNPISIDEIPKINSGDIEDKSGKSLNDGRIVNTWYEVDSTSRSFSTSWAVGRTWTNHTKKAGNRILLSWDIKMRNSTVITNWGGGYTQIDYSTDGGTGWTSLGDNGFGNGVMLIGAGGIGAAAGTFFVNVAAVTSATQIRFRFQHKSYTDTLYVNQNWNATGQMFTNLTIQEIGT